MSVYWTVYALIVLVGTITSGVFLIVHRPTKWRSMESFDASFWVFMVFALYAWTLGRFVLAVAANRLTDPTAAQMAAAIGFGLLFDVALVTRLWHWIGFLRKAKREQIGKGDQDYKNQKGSY